MSKIFNVAVIGVGIGRSHIVEGYVPNADKFKVLALCDLNVERMTPIADEFGVERRVDQFRRRARHGRYRHHRYLHPADAALSDGHGGAQGRQARDLRKAAGRLARPGRRGHRAGKAEPRAS